MTEEINFSNPHTTLANNCNHPGQWAKTEDDFIGNYPRYCNHRDSRILWQTRENNW
jgi:hypothetical protein